MLIELLVSVLVVIGAGFVLVGAVGLVRLPDYFTRLHAPTKAVTVGVATALMRSSGDAAAAIRSEYGAGSPITAESA